MLKSVESGGRFSLTIRAVVLEEHVDLVAGDFNGAAWRESSGNNPQPISTLEEAFADTLSDAGDWTDVCGLSTTQIRTVYGRFVHMVLLELPSKSSVPSERSELPP